MNLLKKSVCFLFLLLSVWPAHAALAEDSRIQSDCIQIRPESKMDLSMMHRMIYESDNSIRYMGHNWAVQTDIRGQIKEEIVLEDTPFESPAIDCVVSLDQALMVGVFDSGTGDTYIGVQRDGEEDFQYRKLNGKAYHRQMYAAREGTFIVGYVVHDERMYLWYALVGPDGYIFEHDERETRMPISALPYACVTDDGFVFYVGYAREGRLQPRKEIVSIDLAGQERWRVVLPDTVGIKCLAASDGNIYVVGMRAAGLNAYDALEHNRAMILCIGDNGSIQWEVNPDGIESFYTADARKGICVATDSVLDDLTCWWLYTVNQNGTPRDIKKYALRHALYGIKLQVIGPDRLIIGFSAGGQLFMDVINI